MKTRCQAVLTALFNREIYLERYSQNELKKYLKIFQFFLKKGLTFSQK